MFYKLKIRVEVFHILLKIEINSHFYATRVHHHVPFPCNSMLHVGYYSDKNLEPLSTKMASIRSLWFVNTRSGKVFHIL